MIVVSETSWLTEERPEEIEQYWKTNYSQIDTISSNIRKMGCNGYHTEAHFIVPENAWTTSYYDLIEKQIKKYGALYPEIPVIQNFLNELKEEITMYYKYKQYFGFVFYIGRKL